MPIKVLHILDNLGMGGAETWLMELIRHWDKNPGVETHILLTGGLTSFFDLEAKSLGATIFYVKYSRSTLSMFIRQFRDILKRGQYNAIHDHSDYTSGIHFLLGFGRLPLIRVAHIHNPWMNIAVNYNTNISRKLIAKVGKRLTYNLATVICGTSQDVLTEYGFKHHSVNPVQIKVLHCGIDVHKFSSGVYEVRSSVREEFSFEPDSQIVLFVGRLDKSLDFNHPQNHKNSSFALHVVKDAYALNSKLRFIMVGAGEASRFDHESLIKEWDLVSCFKLIGIRNDVSRLMKAADILLFPSRQEGLGMVAVEAQAANLPVLASTNIPDACKVVPELFHTLSLNEKISTWAINLNEIVCSPRPDSEQSREMVLNSDFSIQTSAGSLEKLYSGKNEMQ